MTNRGAGGGAARKPPDHPAAPERSRLERVELVERALCVVALRLAVAAALGSGTRGLEAVGRARYPPPSHGSAPRGLTGIGRLRRTPSGDRRTVRTRRNGLAEPVP
ncbi:hypothetical protein ACFV0D_24330 [Streptomyces sp. NPDC059556]|uniref:hypothetical protein n=1 Tax=Streptomyces sp. NPDC059556 TaxID=3346863 RepID=UPI0036C3331B